MGQQRPLLALIFPCYNEEQVLPHSMATIEVLMDDLKRRELVDARSFCVFVDDGSQDRTWDILSEMHERVPSFRAVKLAGNAGHQNALYAGMMQARELGADCIVSLDVDLQDDEGIIPDMLKLHAAGCEIVFGVRAARPTDTAFKRFTAAAFYRLMGVIGIKLVPQHADFRLVGKKALEALTQYREASLFLRGLFANLGFSTATVPYARKPRAHGETKYPLRKMLSFAWKGVTAFSAAPLRLAGVLSLVAFGLAIFETVVVLYDYLRGSVVPGWSSLMIAILFLGAVQLLCTAMLGEYVGRIFTEVKQRPRYVVEKTV